MGARRLPLWVGIVGPDGAGKSTLAEALVDELHARRLRVTHTHLRPQVVVRQPQHRDAPRDPQAHPPRGYLFTLLKYLMAVVDFVVARWRLRGQADVWVCERPLLDYEVDPKRYRLDPRALGMIRRVRDRLRHPDVLVQLDGDPARIAARKQELGAAEVQRQLTRWRDLAAEVPASVHLRLETTGAATPEEHAREVGEALMGTFSRRSG